MKNSIPYILIIFSFTILSAANQTETIDTPLYEESLPFTIRIEQADFSFPTVSDPLGGTSSGIQAFAYGQYKNKRIFLAGRTAGMHWLNDTDSFLSSEQNKYIYVLNLDTKTIVYRSLEAPSSGLSQAAIDLLTPVSTEYVQLEDFLYVMGGYGYNHAISNFDTKTITRVIDLPKAIEWVENGKGSFLNCLSYIEDPFLQVTGGDCFNVNRHRPILLCLGQNFEGTYSLGSNGIYTKQIRSFYFPNGNSDRIIKGNQAEKDPNYRRRDMNIVPIMKKSANTFAPAIVCFAGVFTDTDGVWTVPIIVDEDGSSSMQDLNNPNTLKQGMNTYNCACASLFSMKENKSFVLFFGGISFQYYENGSFFTDPLFPFINNVTTIAIDGNMRMQQYLMDNEFPVINYPSTSNPSYFGTYAKFIPLYSQQFSNGVISFDKIPRGQEILLGYIVGGIQNSARNTGGAPGTSIPSAYIFEVYLTKR